MEDQEIPRRYGRIDVDGVIDLLRRIEQEKYLE